MRRPLPWRLPGRDWLATLLRPGRVSLGSVTAQVDDAAMAGSGWWALSGRPHERDGAELQALYSDALTAWRKNPLAKRIVDITTDYVLGDRVTISSPFRPLAEFIDAFWSHRQNMMDLRLEGMCDELTRAGDLFPLLFRNPGDGMSYLRFVTKDQIAEIVTAPNDWEQEVAFVERGMVTQRQLLPRRTWRGVAHPQAGRAQAVMLHYAVNRPVGALLGESDLATMLPWLLRYTRMLEDRVRLNWAVRAFLWFVTVPTNRVAEKRAQYSAPPEAGSIVVKDDAERWEVQTPMLRAGDAGNDLLAVRRMIDAGSGFPPHWRGEPENATLATAEAMQAPAERHLRRRQHFFVHLLQDILFHAYGRAAEVGAVPPLPTHDYRQLFTAEMPDVSRRDNLELARAANYVASAYAQLAQQTEPQSRALTRAFLRQFFRVLGEPQSERVLREMEDEMFGAGRIER